MAATIPFPDKLAVLDKYVYEYIGLSYVLPLELREQLTNDEAWMENDASMKTTKCIGAISVVRAGFLKTTIIEANTKCEDNTELGKSSDEKYVFYLSTNKVDVVTELFKKTVVMLSDPLPIPRREMVRSRC